MNLGELASPITIYWDLTPSPQVPPDYMRICDQVAAVRPLQLQLLDAGPDLSEACFAILGKFPGATPAITLTTTAGALTPAHLDRLQELGLRGLLLTTASYGALTGMTEVLSAIGGRFATGIAFEVNHDNWRDLPGVVAFCLEHGLSSLVLPMQRLYGFGPALCLTSQEKSELARLLAGQDYSGMRLTIHDPFLWRAFNPKTPFPGGGCQAANTMMAIAPDGVVYPCPAMPLALGSLDEITLKDLVAGEAKKRFREAVNGLPEACRGCEDERGCHGGCRGRSLELSGSVVRPDPTCEIVINKKG